MKTLIIDTAGIRGGVALAVQDRIVARGEWNEPKRQSEILWPLLVEMAEELKWPLNTIEGVVVSNGPGRLTGLRIGLATAKQFCLTSGAKLCQISIFDQILADLGEDCPPALLVGENCGSILPIQFHAPNGEVAPPRGLAVTGLSTELKTVCSEPPCLIVGPGVAKWHEQLEESFPGVTLDVIETSLESLAKCGWKKLQNGQFTDPIEAGPLYLAPAVQR